MRLVPSWKDVFIVLQVLSAFGISMYAGAYICSVGQEKDEIDTWRWVLPYANPCECHKIVMGGFNTRTPIRPFTPKYVDSPLISEDIDEIREHYKLDCRAFWSGFGDWDSCSTTCGYGSQSREAICVTPAFTQTSCNGTPPIETRKCNNDLCPTWGAWANWSDCSATCDSGTQYRKKECNKYGHPDADCNGEQPTENRVCKNPECPTWGDWSDWNDCSVTCDSGTQYRKKECNTYGHPDAECNGEQPEDRRDCTNPECPTWGIWSDWSDCSTTCDSGTQYRKKECNKYGHPDAKCNGEQPAENRVCKNLKCHSKTFDGSNYFLFIDEKTYDKARDACIEQKATLTSIVSQEEQNFLQNFLEEFDLSGQVWIGLNDKQKENKWTWEDGTQFSYSYWEDGQPNDHGNEDCVRLMDNRKWADMICSYIYPMYICKIAIATV